MLISRLAGWRFDSNWGHRTKGAIRAATALLLLVPVLASCHRAGSVVAAGGQTRLQLTSTSFREGRIPRVYTCDGNDTSPELAWSAPPAATKSFALIAIDPDAPMGTFVHWVLYNLPPSARELPEGMPKQGQFADGTKQGQNDFPRTGYGGPCPPRSSTHRYIFVLYALDTMLDLPAGATRAQIEESIKGHIVAHGELAARYSR
ncbi:MAG: YbhB/YbcL family Raf kinase inhibitor-like protein [Terracidiphilus sp.]